MMNIQVEGNEPIPEQPRTCHNCTCHLDSEIVLGGEARTKGPSAANGSPLLPRWALAAGRPIGASLITAGGSAAPSC